MPTDKKKLIIYGRISFWRFYFFFSLKNRWVYRDPQPSKVIIWSESLGVNHLKSFFYMWCVSWINYFEMMNAIWFYFIPVDCSFFFLKEWNFTAGLQPVVGWFLHFMWASNFWQSNDIVLTCCYTPKVNSCRSSNTNFRANQLKWMSH